MVHYNATEPSGAMCEHIPLGLKHRKWLDTPDPGGDPPFLQSNCFATAAKPKVSHSPLNDEETLQSSVANERVAVADALPCHATAASKQAFCQMAEHFTLGRVWVLSTPLAQEQTYTI